MKCSTLITAVALIGAGSHLEPARAELPDVGCKGNACDVVSAIWVNDNFRFYNDGGRPILVSVESGSPGDCREARRVDLAPGEKVDYGPESFCGPIKANYVTRGR
jgi:hypothetical protein